MRSCVFTYRLAGFAIAIATAAAAAPAIDLVGKVVAASGGVPLAGAVVSLLSAGVSDTTDASGSFRITAERISIRRPYVGPLRPIAGRSLEVFDMSGRLLAGKAQAVQRTAGKSGASSAASRGSALPKTAAGVDTLLITRAGFLALKAPIAGYAMDVGTVRLQAGTAGFEIRKPGESSLACGASTAKALDMDLVCEIENEALKASVYVQSMPTGCIGLGGKTYTVEHAWIKTAAGIEPLAEASYDGGGNHMNDRLGFAWKGQYYSLFHSSLGFGYRSCADPDCMQICKDLECRAVVQDGCARSTCAAQPALKARCATVQADGTVPELLDPWSTPAESQSFTHLPCRGDPICQ